MIKTRYILLTVVVTALISGCDRYRTRTQINAPALSAENLIPASLPSANISPSSLPARAVPATVMPASLTAPLRPVSLPAPAYQTKLTPAQAYVPAKLPVGIRAGSSLIAKQDLLEITVFKVPDLTREIKVGDNGSITFPLIGIVRAQGLTPAQLERQIERRLGQDFMNNPQVTVVVKESTKNRITVEGAVKTPGVFPVTGDTTVLQAIALAGGLDAKADTRRAVLLRRDARGQIIQQSIDIAAIRQGRMQDLMLLQDDRIVVPEGTYNRFTVNGEVTNPGVFDLRDGMTVLQAISMAGGLTAKADQRQATLFRRDQSGSFQRYTVNLRNISQGREVDPEIGPDDRIMIAEATLNRFTVAGSVNSPGVFELREGMTLLQAVAMAGGLTDLADREQAILYRRDKSGEFRRYVVNMKSIVEGGQADPAIGLDDRIVLIDHKTRKLLRDAGQFISPIRLF